MSKLFKIFFTGTAIFLMTVPVLFSQTDLNELHAVRSNLIDESENCKLKTTNPILLLKASFDNHSKLLHNLKLKSILDSITLKSDTNMKFDTLGKTSKTNIKTFRMKKSPWLAVGLSALLPGAGQAYNETFWKVPIALGLCGYFGWQVYDNNKQFLDYRDQYAASQSPENNYFGDATLKTLREFYRDQRDDFIWYFTIAYVVNLIDAYIDAHLFDFDVKEEKLIKYGNPDYKLNINFKIKF
jgi:hypothetical protein